MHRHFEIYQNDAGQRVAVARGFSLIAALLGWVWLFLQGLWVEGVLTLGANALAAFLLHVAGAGWPAYVGFQVALGLGVGFAARRFRELSVERQGYAYSCTIPAREGAGALAKLAAVGGVPLPEWRARRMFVVPDFIPRRLRGLAAVAILTVKAAFRFRLVVVLLLLLLAVVIVLPMIIKHDGSAQGFTQILITYTLTCITALLGLATLWLACGTLARDVEDATMQLVCTKPVPRWQVWMGKWTGIMALNVVFLGLTGLTLYLLLYWKAAALPAEQQRVLREEVLVARDAARPPLAEYGPQVEAEFQRRIKEGKINPQDPQFDAKFVRDQIREGLKAQDQLMVPGGYLIWKIPFGANAARLKGKPLQLQAKFYSPDSSGSSTPHKFGWQIGSKDKVGSEFQNSFAAEAPSTFPIGTNLIGDDGVLVIVAYNLNERPVLFPLEDGIEVLFPEGGFGANYVRGLVILFSWLGLLAAIGLFAASKMQFSVAAFVSLSILIIGLSGGTLKQVVEQRGIMDINSETGQVATESFINHAAVIVYGNAQKLLSLITGYSPVDALSTGRMITWGRLAQAVVLVLFVTTGVFATAGIFIFTRRELAAPL